MSNAMRTSKSILAGVAAGALGLALVPFVGAGVASAAAYSGTTSPVRVTSTASVLDVVPYAEAIWTGVPTDDTATITLTSAPTGAATVAISATQAAAAFSGATSTLGAPSSAVALHSNGDDSAIYLAANTPGTYAATIQTYASGAATNTVLVAFTTTGAATSLTLDVANAAVPKSKTVAGQFTLNVKDATGAYTQLQTVDGVTMAMSTGGGFFDDTTVSGTELYAGQFPVALDPSGSTAGSYTATATPTGTPWGSAATGNFSIIDNVAATQISMTESTTVADVTAAVGGAGSAIVKPGTTSLTFDVQVSTANAGKSVVVAVSGTGATASTEVVTTNASGVGTLTVPVTAANAIAGKTVIVTNGSSVMTATYTIGAVYYNSVSRAPAAGTIALATGVTRDLAFTVDDSYGVGQAGYIVIATSDVSGASTVSGTTNSSGEVTVSLPDLSTSSDTSINWTFRVNEPGTANQISGSATPLNLTLSYSATGAVALSDLKYNTVDAADYAITPAVPYAGVVEVAAGTGTDDSYTLTAVAVTVDVANTEVTFSGGDDCSGVWFAASNSRISDLGAAVAAGTLTECSITVVASGATATAYVTSTATGAVEVDAFSSSGNELKGSITFVTDAAGARDVAISAQPAKVAANQTSAVTVSVTDVFGNGVQLDGGGEAVGLVTDFGTFGNGSNIFTVSTTTAGGTATVSITAPAAGIATISAAGTGGQFGDVADVPFTGAAASVSQAAVPVEFTSTPTAKAIVIQGERATVSGRSGIMVDGNVTGIEDGKTVIPYIRFPGQTTFTAGSARPEITDGEFFWQRKTGKRVTVYVTNDDGDVRSNRVTIQAS